MRERAIQVGGCLDHLRKRTSLETDVLPHEAIPLPSISVNGQPVLVLDRGTTRVSGKEAYSQNLLVAKVVTEFVRSTLGPNGMEKMISDGEGVIWVAGDASTILSKLGLQHPIARLMAEASKAVDVEVGDGTTSTIILAGEILKKSEELLSKNIHPAIIIEGCAKALEKSLSIMREIALPVNLKDECLLRKVAETAISGRVASEERMRLAELVVRAVFRVMESIGGRYEVDLHSVNIRTKPGESLANTELIDGIAFFKEIAHGNMPRRVEKARIAVIQGELRVSKWGKTLDQEHKIAIEDTSKLRAFVGEEREIMEGVGETLVGAGANVVIVEKGIDDFMLGWLAQRGVFTIRRVVIEDVHRIAEATGARIITDVNNVATDDLGYANLVEERKVGGEPWIFIEGCKNPKAVTILVRGAVDHMLNEVERSINDALHAVKDVLKKPMVVFGGGAVEEEVAINVRRWAEQVHGKEQMVIRGVAEALESIPLALAENSGLDPLDTILEIRSRHARNERWVGVDAYERKIADMEEAKVCEPLLVKEQMVKSAFETAITILRVDDCITGRKLSKPEFDYKQRKEGSEPERVKKLIKDYGVF